MSMKVEKHRSRVRKYNKFPGLGFKSLWWFDCTCGEYQGYHNKLEALNYQSSHREKFGLSP